MPITVSFEPAGPVLLRLVGACLPADVGSAVRSVLASPRYDPAAEFLWDLTAWQPGQPSERWTAVGRLDDRCPAWQVAVAPTREAADAVPWLCGSGRRPLVFGTEA